MVVAVPRSRVDARRALRAGVDVAERARFPGATTVREAEAFLRHHYPCKSYPDDVNRILASRLAAGRRLCRCTYNGRGLELVPPLPSYGALPSVSHLAETSQTPLHSCAWGFAGAAATARIPISAGADVDAKLLPPSPLISADAGPSPLSRALYTDPNDIVSPTRVLGQYEVARALIAGGADISMANDDCEAAGGEGFDNKLSSIT